MYTNSGSLGASIFHQARFSVNSLTHSPPFQPGSEGRRYVSNTLKGIPGPGTAYSAYTAFTGCDPIAGVSENGFERGMDAVTVATPFLGGGEGEAAAIRQGENAAGEQAAQGNVSKFISSIHASPRLVKEAEEAGRSVQSEIDNLTSQLSQGNMNPGIGTKQVFDDIYEARGRAGARVYFRQVGDTIEILAKSTKANQGSVITTLRKLYGKPGN